MKRPDLDMPEDFVFSTELPIRVDDVNYGGHLGNDRVLTLVHEARVRFLRAHGFSELDVGGPGLIQLNATVVYEAEGELGDPLTINTTPGGISPMGFDFYARLQNRKTDAVLANVRTAMVGYDMDQEQPVRLPEPFVDTLNDLINA